MAVRLSSPEPIKRLGQDIYLTAQENARIFTPNKKHIEIDKATQTLRAYDERGRMFLESLVSTGEPGIDEEGWEKTETLPGFHKIIELMSFRRWSKDEKVKMLNWIGIEPGNEKGIHSLEAVGKFAGYEKFLGKKKSHGCIRLSQKASNTLYQWIGDNWKDYTFIVYIYEKPMQRKKPEENLLLFVQEIGLYSYPLESQDEPKLVRGGKEPNSWFSPEDFLIYKKMDGVWKFLKRGHY
ncbi:MAG: L,D-transpeptidase [Deltaproteobacteria bacterium]|nr:L,D-transpeptidase [Deltaproteobacteria bacterium]